MLPARSDNLMDYVLATYALPRASRTPQEGVGHLAGVHAVRAPRPMSRGWHASAVDGAHGPFARRAAAKADSIEEVWFRGAHCYISCGSGTCWPVGLYHA